MPRGVAQERIEDYASCDIVSYPYYYDTILRRCEISAYYCCTHTYMYVCGNCVELLFIPLLTESLHIISLMIRQTLHHIPSPLVCFSLILPFFLECYHSICHLILLCSSQSNHHTAIHIQRVARIQSLKTRKVVSIRPEYLTKLYP